MSRAFGVGDDDDDHDDGDHCDDDVDDNCSYDDGGTVGARAYMDSYRAMWEPRPVRLNVANPPPPSAATSVQSDALHAADHEPQGAHHSSSGV